MKHILHVVGARPNFMKISPIFREMQKYPSRLIQTLIHTGQHYDEKMSHVFFNELELPEPDINLEVGSGSHAQQTAQIMQRFEPILLQYKPDWVFVPGDVNSTVACALVATKLGFKVAHVEAGLRSFDRSMPEEINRIVTDHLSDMLFTTEPSGNENLSREGIPEHKVHFVGNTMIDTLVRLQPKALQRWPDLQSNIGTSDYLLVTLHRPSNVDNIHQLQSILTVLRNISQHIKIVFPVHPRTRQRIASAFPDYHWDNIVLFEPLGYLDFLAIQMHARLVVTDSGGVQEETTYLKVPCLTLRPNTERPVTITHGTNRLVDGSQSDLCSIILDALQNTLELQNLVTPHLWDGAASVRIVQAVSQL